MFFDFDQINIFLEATQKFISMFVTVCFTCNLYIYLWSTGDDAEYFIKSLVERPEQLIIKAGHYLYVYLWPTEVNAGYLIESLVKGSVELS